MDLNTAQRTFCLGLSGLGKGGLTEVTEVPFTDTEGNLIACNYVEVTTNNSNGADIGAVMVEISGISVGNAVDTGLSAMAATPNASGICGFGMITGYLTAPSKEWRGLNGELAKGLKLIVTCSNDDRVNIIVTYGNKFPFSSMRLDQYDKGV